MQTPPHFHLPEPEKGPVWFNTYLDFIWRPGTGSLQHLVWSRLQTLTVHAVLPANSKRRCFRQLLPRFVFVDTFSFLRFAQVTFDRTIFDGQY